MVLRAAELPSRQSDFCIILGAVGVSHREMCRVIEYRNREERKMGKRDVQNLPPPFLTYLGRGIVHWCGSLGHMVSSTLGTCWRMAPAPSALSFALTRKSSGHSDVFQCVRYGAWVTEELAYVAGISSNRLE